MHKDQRRINEALLPLLASKIASDDAVAVTDCTVLNRLLLEGPDPLFLLEVCPEACFELADRIGLDEEEARSAIGLAHARGPGALLEGFGFTGHEDDSVLSLARQSEAFWLLLASVASDDKSYDASISIAKRLQDAALAIADLHELLHEDESLLIVARQTLEEFDAATNFVDDPVFGVPQATSDIGFYIGYKRGYPCVSVVSGDLVFYGTIPTTTLEEQGIKVDKVLSPHFGIVFKKADA